MLRHRSFRRFLHQADWVGAISQIKAVQGREITPGCNSKYRSTASVTGIAQPARPRCPVEIPVCAQY
jgi:hypothetical protein